MSRPAAFLIAYAAKLQLERDVATASAALRAIPGGGTGPMGLTPDAVKFSAPYMAARAQYQTAHKASATFNGNMLRAFPTEMRKRNRMTRARIV